MKNNSVDKCFNLYYLNLNKVYELSMMINNAVMTNIQQERNTSSKFSKNRNISIGGTLQTDSDYLASIKSVIESNRSSEYSSSSKIIENLDIKTTKSVLLNKIKEKCITAKNISDFKEGDLVQIDDVQLSILDRETLQQMLLLKRDALKGMKVDGIDINNIVSSMIKDYSYILLGNIENDKENKFIIKIPFEIENEFENNYNVDDVLLGKVSLIGIYKNKNKILDITNNTLNYFMTNNNETIDNTGSKFIQSNEKSKQETKRNKINEEYHYIDIISIIQEVKFKEEPIKEKLPWYKRFFNFLRGKKNDEK